MTTSLPLLRRILAHARLPDNAVTTHWLNGPETRQGGALMADINLVDVSLRDGNQSIWGATGVTTRMVEGVTPDLDQVGYRALELVPAP